MEAALARVAHRRVDRKGQFSGRIHLGSARRGIGGGQEFLRDLDDNEREGGSGSSMTRLKRGRFKVDVGADMKPGNFGSHLVLNSYNPQAGESLREGGLLARTRT
jgi:hypothetical protein